MNNNTNTAIEKPKPTGEMSIKHKLMCKAFGRLLVWLGEKLQRVETYEDFEHLDKLEKEYADELKGIHG